MEQYFTTPKVNLSMKTVHSFIFLLIIGVVACDNASNCDGPNQISALAGTEPLTAVGETDDVPPRLERFLIYTQEGSCFNVIEDFKHVDLPTCEEDKAATRSIFVTSLTPGETYRFWAEFENEEGIGSAAVFLPIANDAQVELVNEDDYEVIDSGDLRAYERNTTDGDEARSTAIVRGEIDWNENNLYLLFYADSAVESADYSEEVLCNTNSSIAVLFSNE